MNKWIGLLVLALVSSYVSAKEEQKSSIMVEAALYFVSDDKSQAVQKISEFKLYQGNMSEVHSTPKRLLAGAVWNVEIRVKQDKKVNILFWLEDKNKPLINKNVDISALDLSSVELLKTAKGKLRVDIIPKPMVKELPPVELAEDNFGLNHFCLNDSAVIVDDSFYLGKFTGFGERLFIGVPELHDFELSLKPLRDWAPIGIYKEGIITIETPTKHYINLLNVGIGPSGYQKGGPFKVYGKIMPSEYSKEEALKTEIKILGWHYQGDKLQALKKAKSLNPYIGISRGTIGNDYDAGPHLERAIGNVLTGQECG